MGRHQRKEPRELWSSLSPDAKRTENLKRRQCIFSKQLLALFQTVPLNIFWRQKRAENFEN
jgi:hypothetical protein